MFRIISVHVKLDTMVWLFLKNRRSIMIDDIINRGKHECIKFVDDACKDGVWILKQVLLLFWWEYVYSS